MVDYLLLFIGTPYIWGGNNPIQGFDCSGLICEGLKSEGIIRYYEDLSSQGIFDRLKGYYKEFGPSCSNIKKNDLLFFGSSAKRITHVAIAVDQHRMLEAGGGDQTTTSKYDAGKINAMVRIRPINSRKDMVGIITIGL